MKYGEEMWKPCPVTGSMNPTWVAPVKPSPLIVKVTVGPVSDAEVGETVQIAGPYKLIMSWGSLFGS